jgi:ribosome biogenesis GTPase
MFDVDLAPLRAIGLGPLPCERVVAQLSLMQTHAAQDASPLALQRLTEVHREHFRVHDGRADRIARARPRLLRELADDEAALAVGDWVLTAREADHGHWIEARVPPLNHLVRRDADGRRHAVVSNVDAALLVMGLDDDFNPRRLERYLALVQGHDLPAVVVLTKADVAALRPGAVDEAMAVLRRRLPPGLPMVAVDGTSPQAAVALAPWIAPMQTVVLLGSSGAGKSTLTNTLAGRLLQDTGAVRSHDSRGKHTTTARTLFPLPGGACVIDTPGLRALRPDLDEVQLEASFADIQALAPQCRFRNCRHGAEPGCAVRAGVDADRLRNHDKLLREARRDTLSALERQRLRTQWKAQGRAGEARARAKRQADW